MGGSSVDGGEVRFAPQNESTGTHCWWVFAGDQAFLGGAGFRSSTHVWNSTVAVFKHFSLFDEANDAPRMYGCSVL